MIRARPRKRSRCSAPHRLLQAAPLAAALVAVGACGNPPPLETANKDDQNLIGGFVANDPRLDAVGSLAIELPFFPGYPGGPVPVPRPGGPGFLQHFCTAALLTPETLITAAHCVDISPFAYSFGGKVVFAVGPDVNFPRLVVDVAAVDRAPEGEWDFFGLPRDVAVVHLEHPLEGVQPVDVGTLSEADLDLAFAAIGYGIQDNAGRLGTRRVGQQTIGALEGKIFEALFGSFGAFLDWVLETIPPVPPPPPGQPGSPPGPATPPGFEELLRMVYDSALIDAGYEAVTGLAPGDSQICSGDSGSPLLKKVGDKVVSFGVASRALFSTELVCDIGGIYDTFGPETMAFLEEAKTWVDPCGDVDPSGYCDGNVATRCTNVVEGRRRIVTFDCGILGMTCNMGSGAPDSSRVGGQVSCDSNPFEGPRVEPDPAAPIPDVTSLVENAFRLTPADITTKAK